MKALVYRGPEAIVLEDIPQPEPVGDESLLKVRAVGICGSDFEGFLGKTGRRTPPMVMGHEFSATVEAPAKNSRFKSGDRVVVQPKLYCGTCRFCSQGLTNLCPGAEFFGVMTKNGAMAEYLAVPERCLFRFDDRLDFRSASMVEPLAVAYRAAHQIPEQDLRQADYTLVVGAGTIGLLILQMLKLRGAGNLIVSDLSDHRCRIARELGAAFTLNPQKEDFQSRIKDITAGAMVDVAVEAVGFETSVSQALSAMKNRGTFVWVGLAQKMIQVDMQQIVTSEANIRGSFIYSEKDFLESLKLIEAGKIRLDLLITASEPLDKGVHAFDRLKKNRDGKVIKILLENG